MSLSFRSKRSFAAGALLLTAVLGGCVSKACPDGQKLQSGKCVPKGGASHAGDADAAVPEPDGGMQDAAPASDAAVVTPDADVSDAGADAAADAAPPCAQPLHCWQDEDHDGYAARDAASMSLACETKCPTGWTSREPAGDDVDCKDSDTKVRPRRCWRDADMDGFAADAHDTTIFCAKACSSGWTATEPKEEAIDCNESSSSFHPKASETCDGKDGDCDGEVDEDADETCASEHASGVCVQGACEIGKCATGFGDCDGSIFDGCEQALDVADNCGACGSVCDPFATCGASKVKGVGHCACDAPSFGDGATCHGPGPISAGARWTFMINNSLHLQYVGNSSATIVTKMPADTKFRQVAISNTLGQGCGITVAGKLECWTGEITPGDGEFVQVVAGDTTVCGLTTDHDAMCWAYTGNGAPFGEATPPEQKFTQLAAGFYHFCGLRDDGKVFCWGAGSSERAPNCNSSDIHYDCSQAQPPTDKFVQITAGRLHTCGLKADGSVKCWGLGVNSLTSPGAWEYGQSVPPPSEVFSSISAGQWHTCGIRKSDGTAVCWGAGKSGASAQYDHGQSEPTDDSFLVLSAGWVHTCGLTTQNRMVCWGANDDGEAPPSTLGSFPLNPGR